ncbi:MAG: Na+/H+ antiporter NhaA [Chitinophagaceae bacterium]|nr:Na+/H+ antiporter NhaA [Chitinophagaceae bacterium]
MKLVVRKWVLDPLETFFQDSRAVGITLLVCTITSLLIANINSVGTHYINFWTAHFSSLDEHHAHVSILSLPNSVLMIINDGLMGLLFFLAGMEIKRELFQGELASIKQSLLPVFGAFGGMIAPAILFSLINKGTQQISGWAIPTATDIAFTLGIASLLGKRIPIGLKIFLTALAIIDDLGAIIVIAIFYGGNLHFPYLLGAIFLGVFIYLINMYKKQFGVIQIVLGILLWYCMFNSGIHATIAGVVFAFLMPLDFLKNLEKKIYHAVYFVIIPLFVLANTAIPFPENSLQHLNGKLSWGIFAGLCIGKPLGIVSCCYFLVSKKWAKLPEGVNWYKMIGAGILAGIGFTMSIFISTLAFDQIEVLNMAKISVLFASFIAIAGGYIWFRLEKNPATLKP